MGHKVIILIRRDYVANVSHELRTPISLDNPSGIQETSKTHK